VDAAVQVALNEQRQELARLYERRLAAELSERWPSADAGDHDERFENATVMFVDTPHYAGVAEKLNAQELTELIKKFYGSANDTTHLFGARHMQFIGEGMIAVFTDDTNTRTVNHGLRAARCALGLVESSHGIARYLTAAYPQRQLPPFEVNVALHAGAVTLTQLADPLHGSAQKLPVGDAVTAAMQLQKKARVLGWPVAGSVTILRSITGAVRIGRRALVEIPGRTQPIDAAEIVELAL